VNDDDLAVSCKDGCTEIIRKGAYHTHDLSDAADVGFAAETLCKHGWLSWTRVKKLCLGVGILAVLVGATGWVVGEVRKMSLMEAEKWSNKAEQCLKVKDFAGAVHAYTQAVALHPTVRSYLSRSFAHAELGNLQASLDDCEAAVRLDPTNQAAVRTRDRAKAELAENP
jgi:tetratricopeptide (TPR) repeat protein